MLTHAATWINLQRIKLIENGQIQEVTYLPYILFHLWSSLKMTKFYRWDRLALGLGSQTGEAQETRTASVITIRQQEMS